MGPVTDVPPLAIGGRTRLMGLIGDPIDQVKTPQKINPIFRRKGADIACIPIHVAQADLTAVWAGLKAMRNLVGFGVTLPHKAAALALCDSLDPLAASVGAVNVVCRQADGGFRGLQLDGLGFVTGLESRGHRVAGRDCHVFGAGGAAAAIAFALVDAGAAVVLISNRTRSRAATVVSRVNAAHGAAVATLGDGVPADGQIIINATSLGMDPGDPLIVDAQAITPSMLVAEVVAKVDETRLLQEAARRGAQTHSGVFMVENQVGLIAERMIAASRPA